MKKQHIFAFLCILAFLFFPKNSDSQVVIAGHDIEEAVCIVFGEVTGDQPGWSATLNTYYKTKRSGETLIQNMKRVSSAYRTKSRQYRKCKGKDFNSLDWDAYNGIKDVVKNFKPDPDWPYIHHENMSICTDRTASGRRKCFYDSYDQAIAHLTKAWGTNVDFKLAKRIGKETYFPAKKR